LLVGFEATQTPVQEGIRQGGWIDFIPTEFVKKGKKDISEIRRGDKRISKKAGVYLITVYTGVLRP